MADGALYAAAVLGPILALWTVTAAGVWLLWRARDRAGSHGGVVVAGLAIGLGWAGAETGLRAFLAALT